MKHATLALHFMLIILAACEQITPEYPDEPVVDYQSFGLYMTVDQLGNTNLTGRLTFDFTDGDGNLGLQSLDDNTDPDLPDTVKYNFFLQLYDLQGYEFVKVPESEGGILKYRIPVLDRQPIKGTMDLDISYPVIVQDTIYYTFYIYDRDYNRSNIDTTDVQVLSNIDLDQL